MLVEEGEDQVDEEAEKQFNSKTSSPRREGEGGAYRAEAIEPPENGLGVLFVGSGRSVGEVALRAEDAQSGQVAFERGFEEE